MRVLRKIECGHGRSRDTAIIVSDIAATSYTDATTGAHLRSLPSQVSTFDAGGVERSRSSFEYDNYNTDANHAGLIDRPNIINLDAAFTTSYLTRGNVTTASNYLLTNGTVTGSVTSYAQYDIAGNVVKAIDARGYATELDFSDRFGVPDGEARANSSSAELIAAGKYSYAFATFVRNAANLTAYAQFDYYLSQAVDGEDANGVVSSGYFNDALDRPTQVVRANNQAPEIKSQTRFAYDDVYHVITTSSDQNTFNDPNPLKSQVVYDGLGRTTEKRQYETPTAYLAVLQTYDALGRSSQNSNPYRAGESIVWTTIRYDALSRITSVTTPDSAVVGNSYSGNTATVTDQAQRVRRSITDGLGRLVRVDEPDSAGNLGPVSTPNQPTNYSYDTLDNLTQVTQGTQPARTFSYDSLKRLTSATNPESGAVTYQYDANGNLTSKTDARGVVSNYVYDALNRVTTVLYRINGQPDPNTGDVQYLYDNAQNGKGRLWLTFTWGANPFQTAVGGYDALGRVTQFYRLFGNGQGGWNPAYEIDYTYDFANHVKTMTYPSRRTVSNAYDGAGRLTSFTGNLGDGASRTYATGISYSSLGGLQQEQFGTQTAVYHKLHYNVRGQLNDIRASTVPWQTDQWNWNRGGIINYYATADLACQTNECRVNSGPDNNGNVRQSQHFVPANDQITGYSFTEDRFSYDSLNRLEYISEYHGTQNGYANSEDFKQAYTYDRWGNRRINNAATWGAGINNAQSWIDSNNNRLYAPSDQNVSDPEQRLIRYDAAGNQKADYYTAGWQGTRTYDAENRMKTATDTANNTSTYVYDGDGRRIKRVVGNTETWQIYGLGGELIAEYAAGAAPTNPKKEYGYRNGELLVTADAPPSNSAAFVTTDTTTQGNWKGAYGSDGYNIINDAVSYPAYAQVSVSGQSAYTWAASTTETRALLKAASSTDRLASCWYSGTDFTIDINLTDGNSHRVSVYALDWDGANGRNGTIDVLDATSNAVLDTRPLNSYSSGKYFVWQMRGHIKIRFTHISPAGWNQVVSGLFFDNGATNLALNKPTSQSSEGWGGASSRAVDGNTDGNWANNSVTHTQYDNGAWWRVDLGGTYSISSVELWNRADCCADRLTNFNVVLLDANYAVVNSVNVPGQGGYPTTVSISGAARWVVVHLVGTNYLSLAEVKVWSATTSAQLHWLVTDQLGTPRMVFDQTGSLANVSRHDYLPFGEEVPGGFRSSIPGYATGDNVRQKFTQKERDDENGLDYFLARSYSSTLGRFISVDPLMAGARVTKPQSWNRYAYVLNNPLRLVDPSGLVDQDPKAKDKSNRCTPQTPCIESSEEEAKSRPPVIVVEVTVPIPPATPIETIVNTVTQESFQTTPALLPLLEPGRGSAANSPVVDPTHFATVGVSYGPFNIALMEDIWNRWYITVGGTYGLSPLITASVTSGTVYDSEGSPVVSAEDVYSTLTGPSVVGTSGFAEASANICCTYGPAIPTGTHTRSSGYGVPQIGIGRQHTFAVRDITDWFLMLPMEFQSRMSP
jgi:RHS repeat-associated protein